jgi:hypothetical protein
MPYEYKNSHCTESRLLSSGVSQMTANVSEDPTAFFISDFFSVNSSKNLLRKAVNHN